MEINDIFIESDAQEAISLIVENDFEGRPLMLIISDCKKLLLEFNRYKIKHAFRESNGVADHFI